MTQQVEVVDAEGAVRAYLDGYPGLTGATGAIVGGIHFGSPRSPSKGAVAGMTVVTRTLDGPVDEARVSFRVKAVGGELGPRELVGIAARALVRAVLALADGAVVVTTRRGDSVRIVFGGELAGPTDAGDLGGEYAQAVDATFWCQSVAGP